MTVADLTPDALARLESKLIADLEMVRKVRALLTEHLPMLNNAAAGGSAAAAPASTPASTPIPQPSEPAVKRKPYDEVLLDCLLAMPEQGFAPKDFARAVYKVTNILPGTSTVKTFLNRMIRQGKATVAEARTGRNGSLYRCTVSQPVSADQSNSSSVSPASPPVLPVNPEISPAPPAE